jgi:hypothetical protein
MYISLHQVYEQASAHGSPLDVAYAGLLNADIRRSPKLQICAGHSRRYAMGTIELMHRARSGHNTPRLAQGINWSWQFIRLHLETTSGHSPSLTDAVHLFQTKLLGEPPEQNTGHAEIWTRDCSI